ncbi:DUF4105 domain-containing protein [Halobacteriovorax sp. JY17]|uniref:lipoprotein N-acyltransferase Lnb domain-containing protein n=1 Tax=Halobacteriovorax sp. JY17 TaxID=2014617 RepID=UPI0025C31F2E|nr:DUF4105 domain-containing protein [Halobacteriovorax sp. JY17]
MKIILLFLLFFSKSIFSQEVDSVEFLQWYAQKKELYTSSKKYIQRLKKKIANNQVIGLELIIASATDERVESKFGHSLFRFVDNDDDPGNDITISFVADVNGPKASNIGGVIGKYGVYPEVKSLRLFVNQYVKEESRPLERHLIPSNSQMQQALMDALDDWWNEIHIAKETIYKKALKEAKDDALKKAEKLFGEDNYELFEIKFFDEEFKVERIHSFGLLEKEEVPFENNEKRDAALYRQAYTRAYNLLDVEAHDIVLNLFQEVWKVESSTDILSLETLDLKVATDLAQQKFSTDRIKLFQKFNQALEPIGYYAMTLEYLENISILKRASIELSIKNLEIKSAASEDLGKYTFFSNNCAGAVIKFLKKANFPHKRVVGIQGRVPVKLNKWMSRSLLVPYPSKIIEGAQKLNHKIARILGFSDKDFISYTFPIHQWKIISKYISDSDKFLFFDLYDQVISTEYSNLVRSEIEPLKAPKYHQIYGLEILSPKLYQLCSSKKCALEIESELKRTWSKKEIKEVKKLVHRTGNNTFIYEGLKNRPEVLTHLKLLKYIPLDFSKK